MITYQIGKQKINFFTAYYYYIILILIIYIKTEPLNNTGLEKLSLWKIKL